jgi:hypothetical protein
MSSLIPSALAAALILSLIWWIAALQVDNRRRAAYKGSLDARNDAIDAHHQRNLKRFHGDS